MPENKKISLVMGLSGSGKTFFTSRLRELISDSTLYLNGDEVRKQYDDWDFSHAGRIRQAERMRKLADEFDGRNVIIDMICPLKEMRTILQPCIIFFMDRESDQKYPDTDSIFEKPTPDECQFLFFLS